MAAHHRANWMKNVKTDIRYDKRTSKNENHWLDIKWTRTPPLPPSSPHFWIRLPYLGRASSALASEFRRYGYNIGFYPLTQVNDLSRLKDPTPKLEKPGVYELLCSCEDLYVGQTGRTINERFKEHRRDFKSLQKKKTWDRFHSDVKTLITIGDWSQKYPYSWSILLLLVLSRLSIPIRIHEARFDHSLIFKNKE